MRLLKIAFILFSLGISDLTYAQGTWSAIANYTDTIENAVGLSIGNKGYVGLGNNANGDRKDWWEYDPAANTWTQKADFGGTARIKATGFGIGTKAYVGLGLGGIVSNKDWWEYNQATNSWAQKTSYPGNGSYTTVSFVIQGKGYVGTGATITFAETVYKDFWEYDPATDTWTQKADFGGVKRRHAMGFAIGCKGYLGCGWDQSAFSWYKDFWEYVPQTNTWTQKADYPFNTEGGAAFSIGNKGYLGLGEGPNLHNEFNEYDPAANTWSSLPNFPGGARNRVAAFVIDTIAYVGTGGSNNGTNSFYKYIPNNYTPVGACCIMALSDTSVNETCGNANGSATVTAISGNSPFTYLWSNGQTAQTATGLTAGTYSVTVTDGSGSCSDTINITVGAVVTPVAAIAPSSLTICAGGSAILTAAGATSGTTFLWSTGATTASITVSPASDSTFYVTATNTCGSDTAQATVTVGTGTLSVSTGSTVASCGQCNGTATATPTGGTGTYSYLWNDGQTSQAATGLCSGNYTVTVSEGSGGGMNVFWSEDFSGGGTGWTLNTTGPGTNGNIPNIWIVNTSASWTCATGNFLHITCDPAGLGCTPGDYAYNDTQPFPPFLNDDPSTDVIAISPDISTIGKANINLKFKWKSDGYPGDDFAKLRLSNDGGTTWTELSTSYSGASVCGTDSITLPAIYENVSNLKIAFRWQNTANTTSSDPPFGVDDIELATPAGGASCSSVTGVTVGSSGTVAASVLSNNTSCSTNNGSAIVNASGGTTPYSYLWSNGDTTSTITGLAAGSYIVTVTDAAGCSVVDGTVISAAGGPSVTATSNNVTCNGGNNGSAMASGSGGSSPYSYSWSNGQNSQSVTGLSSGTYTVIVADNNSCTDTATVVITQPAAINSSFIVTDASCGMADGSLTAAASGGVSPYSYLWSNGQATATASALTAGSYSITITDANNCALVSSASVSNAGAPTATISAADPGCNNGNDGNVAVSVAGGTSPYAYNWSNGQTSSTISGLSPGIYTVTVTDAGNCQTVISDTINNPAPVQILFAGGDATDTICSGNSSTITAFGGVSYLWSNGLSGSTITVNPQSDFSYYVTVTDASGCTGKDTFVVVVISASITAACSGTNIILTASSGTSYLWSTGETAQSISVSPSALTNYMVTVTSSCGQLVDTIPVSPPVNVVVSNDTIIEYGATIQLSASGGINYLWNTGETSQNITVAPLENTAYMVTITDASGCSDTASIHITVDDSKHAISVPTIFSPNKDGINDFIKVHGYGIKELKFTIYDRWGEKIFETTDKSASWDGTFNGKPLNSAVFVYTLDAIFIDETEFHSKGNITLLR